MLSILSKEENIGALLIDNGARVGIRNVKGSTALIFACGKNLVDTIRLLIKDGGSDVNEAANVSETVRQ